MGESIPEIQGKIIASGNSSVLCLELAPKFAARENGEFFKLKLNKCIELLQVAECMS